MPSVGRWYNIRCYKHNGALHRVWDRGLVLENNNDFIVIASKKAKVVESNGRCWFTKEPAVTIATSLPQASSIKTPSNTLIMI